MNRILYIVLLSLVTHHVGFAQTKREEWMKQQLIDTPITLSLDKFLGIYFQSDCYDYPRSRCAFGEDARDNKYAYWSDMSKMRNEKYKVLLSDLERIKFKEWNASEIKKEFFMRVIAEEDRQRPGDPFICNVTPSVAEYTVTYIPNINAVRIDLHWKIYCEIIFKLVNQKRCAIYDFDTGTFTDIDPVR